MPPKPPPKKIVQLSRKQFNRMHGPNPKIIHKKGKGKNQVVFFEDRRKRPLGKLIPGKKIGSFEVTNTEYIAMNEPKPSFAGGSDNPLADSTRRLVDRRSLKDQKKKKKKE